MVTRRGHLQSRQFAVMVNQSQWSLAVVNGGQQADGDARRTGLDVDPERDPRERERMCKFREEVLSCVVCRSVEGDPREDDDEQAGQVDLNDEVADVARQDELYFKARKRPCEPQHI